MDPLFLEDMGAGTLSGAALAWTAEEERLWRAPQHEGCRRCGTGAKRVETSSRVRWLRTPRGASLKRKIDSPLGRAICGRRIATIEPVFANLQNKGMRRFTLHGRGKVSTQWQLFTLVHNIEKIAHAKAA